MFRRCLTYLMAGLGLAWMSAAAAKQVDFKVAVATPVMQADKQQTAFVKISLTGFPLERAAERPSANVAIVLDKSGSMGGLKIQQARQAAITAVQSLSKDDIVSIIAYDERVRIVVPATKLGADKSAVINAISRINAGGNTALFAGVSKGAHEVRKFLDSQRVNRVILLSDGQANVGPSSASELAQLGASLGREGISVTTLGLGLGYNEDLMAQLAGYSDGNHAFVENAQDLAKIFEYEFGDVKSVVAQGVDVRIRCADGIRPIRVLGRQGEILGQEVHTRLNQLYSEQEKFVLLEVEVPPRAAGVHQALAAVDVSYTNMLNQREDRLQGAVGVRFSPSQAEVAEQTNVPVMESAVQQLANTQSKEAMQLRDQGKVEEARNKLKDSAEYLKKEAKRLKSKRLAEQERAAREDAEKLDEEAWRAGGRKSLRAKQYRYDKQQKY